MYIDDISSIKFHREIFLRQQKVYEQRPRIATGHA